MVIMKHNIGYAATRIEINWNFGLMAYGPRWRGIRRIFHENFTIKAVPKYQDIQVKFTRYVFLAPISASNTSDTGSSKDPIAKLVDYSK